MSFIAGNLVGAVALILSVIGLQQNTDKKFLFFQIVINLLYTLQYFLLNATAGLSICLVNAIRCIIFYFYKKEEKSSIFPVLLFIAIYLFLGLYTLNKPFDIILMFGTIIYTYSLSCIISTSVLRNFSNCLNFTPLNFFPFTIT